ncbi:MAG: biotin/lipoyl-binding protein [Saprospiraceae bacterium]|nr:biotin/lipoyl-binding protein [Saprospiraceae bacterium]
MFTEPFRIAVNDRHEFDALPEDAKNLDLLAEADGQFHLLHNGRSIRAELLEADYATRRFTLRINGTNYQVKIADHYERLVQQLGLHANSGKKTNTVKAPMPGLVLTVMVTSGQTVQKGDPLLILEAMKMENVIKAANDGQVKAVMVQQGAAVDKGQLLLEME